MKTPGQVTQSESHLPLPHFCAREVLGCFGKVHTAFSSPTIGLKPPLKPHPVRMLWNPRL